MSFLIPLVLPIIEPYIADLIQGFEQPVNQEDVTPGDQGDLELQDQDMTDNSGDWWTW